jgi:hypothetical protein
MRHDSPFSQRDSLDFEILFNSRLGLKTRQGIRRHGLQVNMEGEGPAVVMEGLKLDHPLSLRYRYERLPAL